MRLFDRWRSAEVPADVGTGFWVAEAAAMQRAIITALAGAECSRSAVPARVELSPGAEGRVVVVWRNVIVGFVPPDHAAPLRGQLAAAGKATLVAPGLVVAAGGQRRVWVGEGAPVGEPPADELAPPLTTIFGINLPGTTPRQTTTARRWVLAVGSHSWEVREGTDLDVVLLRRRIAEAEPGATVHLLVWGEPVAIDLGSDARVTLTDPVTGEVEVLHPR
ncbi:hypothetical protein M3148_01795 [Georgenia satyanarayanai]|uniref:hypothetical protein n=1 Tax=Georgenia satyanarayanai TaxID=860221 RepID=UPI00203E2A00|nr:hypothetical protein [Georgenia satyanarayanai]MCM3659731.1 hypothetical protein [Georgenia satyanarayanai]